MNPFNLESFIEVLLRSTTQSISIKDVQQGFSRYLTHLRLELDKEDSESRDELASKLQELPPKLVDEQIEAAFQSLANRLQEQHALERLMIEANGYKLGIAPQYVDWVRAFRNETRPTKLSNSIIETLALVAYRQPVTRAEMEMIRGVSIDSALQKLQDLGLIHISGHSNLPGKPRLYSTTDEFLNFCGIHSLEELPASDILSQAQITNWVQEANKREIYKEQDLGL